MDLFEFQVICDQRVEIDGSFNFVSPQLLFDYFLNWLFELRRFLGWSDDVELNGFLFWRLHFLLLQIQWTLGSLLVLRFSQLLRSLYFNHLLQVSLILSQFLTSIVRLVDSFLLEEILEPLISAKLHFEHLLFSPIVHGDGTDEGNLGAERAMSGAAVHADEYSEGYCGPQREFRVAVHAELICLFLLQALESLIPLRLGQKTHLFRSAIGNWCGIKGLTPKSKLVYSMLQSALNK